MRYIIDVTQLIHWSGNLTGIPRVMDELAVRFLNDDSRETIFISWIKEANAMCELDLATSREFRGKYIAYTNILGNVGNPPVRQAATNPTKSPLYISKKILKKAAHKSRLTRTAFYQKVIENKTSLEAKSYKKYIASRHDKLFIPWGEWWDQDWLDLLKIYTKNGVELYPVSHDVLPMIVPQFSGNSSSLENFVAQIFPISTKVLTVSQSSKNDLLNWMKRKDLPTPQVEVFRLGEDFSIENTNLIDSDLETKYSIKKNEYLVYVSTIEPRKNHLLLYYTYKLAASRNIILPHLVIIGRVGHDMDSIIHLIKNDPEINSLISIENDVDDNDLNWLYQNSKFAVTSSFYEGWGMSVLESITRGKPVVCSATSSLMEMPDDCVIRFNPASTDECLTAIQKMMQPNTLSAYIENTKKYAPHSWDASYSQVIDILDGDKKS